MFTLYKGFNRQRIEEIQVFNTIEEAKEYTVTLLSTQDGLTKEQAVLLVELGMPVRWTNNDYIIKKETNVDIIFATSNHALYYQIVK